LKPGGRLYLADVVVYKPVPNGAKAEVDLWTACIGGALLEAEYLDAINNAGLREVEVVSTKDVFAGAGGEASAQQFETMGANIGAIKP